jgi:endonuclease/exonuclease/phosphatase family metal-dependent hydrolase
MRTEVVLRGCHDTAPRLTSFSLAARENMKLRFASWNVNNRNPTRRHVEIFWDVRPDILALQEVCPAFHDALASEDVFAWDAFSLKLRPASKSEGRSRRLGCSLLGTARFRLCSCSLVPRLVFPERTLVATVEANGGVVTVCSFHTPPGASWGEVKPRTLKAIAQWLRRQPPPLIFGIDANCPKMDHPDIQRNEWWWEDEPLLLGAVPLHKLQDVFRVYLANNPNELAGIVGARPNGPLAISYVRGSGPQTTECRYDFIYATPDVRVDKVAYVFDDTIREASDHALVIADLVLNKF